MRGSFRLFQIFGISINLHVTFFLLLLLYLAAGVRAFVLIIGIFIAVTIHELCHALVAQRFGIKVREITLLPIGGLASMSKMPERPSQEFLIALAGPLSNIGLLVVFYVPLRLLLGEEVLFHPLSIATWPLTVSYIYWVNLVLALFNLIPAFPMDGGRILRALLARRMDYRRATKIAVNFGHVFALIFAYLGIVRGNLILIAIAIFIYMAASGEGLQVDVKQTLKKFRIRDILPREILTVKPDATLANVLELIYHSHQEDFPVVDGAKLVGFLVRQDIMTNVHQFGVSRAVADVMRKAFPHLSEHDTLMKAQSVMQAHQVRALPVMRGKEPVGVITLEDIAKLYSMVSVQ